MASAEEDPREKELREIEARLTKVLAVLKGKHTAESVSKRIADAESRLGDHRDAFVPLDGTMITGTHHLGALVQLADALQVKIDMARKNPLNESVRLLERKVALMRELHRI